VLDLLFTLAAWHGYAKLRIPSHTETTLGFLESSTTALGQILRQFVNATCTAFRTQELPRETAARGRRKAAMAAKTAKPPPSTSTTKKSSAKSKSFNLHTYKLHALADYAKTIRLFGTTDNYNSQVVRLIQFVFSFVQK
jgi:hypothetical protein